MNTPFSKLQQRRTLAIWSGILAAFLTLRTGHVFSQQVNEPASLPANGRQIEFFEKSIRPLLVKHCYECHSSEAKSLEGGLSLQSRDGLMRGGDRGPAVVPGNPDASLLIKAIRRTDPSFQMPPDSPLSSTEIADLEKWIRDGAHDPRVGDVKAGGTRWDPETAQRDWPFSAVSRPVPPTPKDATWAWSDVDVFVRERQERMGLSPVGDADPLTWLRRVNYDLLGLPPTPSEMQAFALDRSPDADDRLVDRLLASPKYGERWGRHWLDVVRYADTAGDNSDYPIPQMYKYRNWVIQAWNTDMPFDQFVGEQLAGDLLSSQSPQEREQRIIATGYIANARRFGSRVDDYPQHLTIEDTIDNLGRAFLGLSLNCARCHNHKFDPISTKDYYGLYAFFQNTRYPWPGIELEKRQRDLVPLAPPEQVQAVSNERKSQRDFHAQEVRKLEDEKSLIDKEFANLARRSESKDKSQPTPEEPDEVAIRIEELRKRTDQLKLEIKNAKAARDTFDQTPLPYEQAYAVWDRPTANPTRIQIKGDPEHLGDVVDRSIPDVFRANALGSSVLVSSAVSSSAVSSRAGPISGATSGRQQLADWIASKENPLTARVFVNRVWLYHFGRGIVPTPNDYGKQGKPPTHPEMLDYLASRFMEEGWSIKALQRRLVLARTYRLESRPNELANQIDPSNDWLWRYRLRRLDAESIRDTLLTLSGNLDESMGAAHPFPPQTKWDFTQHKPFKAVYESNRRSVYLMTQRIQRHPFLAIFDGPDTSASTGSRITSTTTLQALYFFNDPFVHDQVRDFVSRLLSSERADEGRIRLAYQLVMGRDPLSEEVFECQQYLEAISGGRAGLSDSERTRAAWESLARALLRTNEFLYLN